MSLALFTKVAPHMVLKREALQGTQKNKNKKCTRHDTPLVTEPYTMFIYREAIKKSTYV